MVSGHVLSVDTGGSKEQMSSGSDDSARGFLSEGYALEEGLRLGMAGIWRWQVGSEKLQWTKNLEGIHLLPPESFDGTLETFRRDLHPDDADTVWQKIEACIESGEPYRAVYRTAPRDGAPEVWIETCGGVTVDSDGLRYLTGVCLDVTQRVRKERELKRRLAQQSAVARFGSSALNEPDLQKVLDYAVCIAAEVFDVPLTKILQFADSADHLVLRSGVGWATGLVGRGTVGIETSSQAGFTLACNQPVLVHDLLEENRFHGPQLLHDHGVRSGISVVISGTEARAFGVFGVHDRVPRQFDQTDAEFLQSLANIVAGAARQNIAVERQRLLVREMAHRAGNLLQLVTSIARQTFSSTLDTNAARHSFSERLGALARSNYVVSRGGWTSTRIRETVEEALRPFGDRFVIQGRDVLLPPDLCFDMGIVLHELATNSVKHGTLGQNVGSVHVTWSNDTGQTDCTRFCFEWDDRYSQAGTATNGAGFGSMLVRALIEKKWNGTLKLASVPHFQMKIEIPLSTTS